MNMSGFVQHRRVTLGQLLGGTFRELARVNRELAAYFTFFLLAGFLSNWFEILLAPFIILTTIAYFMGQYWLYRQILVRGGFEHDPAFKGWSFFAMALILGMLIMIGLQVLFIPGILLASKWIMAPSFLVAERIDLGEAISRSWRASRENLVSIALAFTILSFGWMIVFATLTAGIDLFGRGGAASGPSAFGWVLFHIYPVLMMGLSIAAFRELNDGEHSLVAVFE